jgi:hypothetical protein
MWDGWRPGLLPVEDDSPRGFHFEEDSPPQGLADLWDSSRIIHQPRDRSSAWPLVWAGVLLSACWLAIGLVLG